MLLAAALAGCGSTPALAPKVDEEAVAGYRAAGYPAPAPVPIVIRRIQGPPTEAPWTVTLTRPEAAGVQPLIVYLPAMGDADDAANRWSRIWAGAGYAVMAIQVLDGDADVWATPEARSGDFERIARARFDDELMGDRIARLAALLREIRTRSLRGEPGLDGLDWSHLALAGADLGAYTVQCILNSPPATLTAVGWPLEPRAYIMISPYALRSAPAPEQPLAAHAPVLMVSSADDVDAYGVITDPAVRRLAYDRLGAGEAHYLELGSAAHRWLSGHALSSSGIDQPPAHRPAMMEDEAMERRRRHIPAQPDASDTMAPGDDEDMTPAKRAQMTASREQMVKARSRVLTHAALSEVSLGDVSLAFLDDHLRAQAAAGAWLGSAAPKWLQTGDRLKSR